MRWMERIAAGEPPLIFGDGTQTMDFVFVTDVARANVLAAEADVTDAVFNVASGVETSLHELARTLLRVMGSDLPVEHGPERAVNKVPRRLADVSGARDELGFSAEVGLEEGLTRLVDWWRATKSAPRRSRLPWRRRRQADGGPVRTAVVRRRRGRGGRRGDRLRVADAGPAGRRSSSAPSRSASAPPTRWRRRAARRRCSSPCTRRASARATR